MGDENEQFSRKTGDRKYEPIIAPEHKPEAAIVWNLHVGSKMKR